MRGARAIGDRQIFSSVRPVHGRAGRRHPSPEQTARKLREPEGRRGADRRAPEGQEVANNEQRVANSLFAIRYSPLNTPQKGNHNGTAHQHLAIYEAVGNREDLSDVITSSIRPTPRS